MDPLLLAGLSFPVLLLLIFLRVPIGLAMLVVFVAFGLFTEWLLHGIGAERLLWTAAGVFVIAWIGQFIGHLIEGARPSFLTDLAYLLIGPAWLADKLMRRLQIHR